MRKYTNNKKRYINAFSGKFIFSVFLLFFLTVNVNLSFGQIWSLNFETEGGYTTDIEEFTDGSKDYFIRTDGSDISSAVNFTNIQGSYFFAAQDIDGEGATIPATLNIDDIDISEQTNLYFKVYIAEDDDASNQDWDDTDYLHIDYDIDNSGSFSNLIWIESSGATNTAPLIDTDFDGTGDGVEITSNFEEFGATISETGSTLDIRITFNLNSGDEDIAIDSLVLVSYTPAGEPEISNITIIPNVPTSSEAVDVACDISDEGTITSASLSWGFTQGGPYDEGTITMLETVSKTTWNYGTETQIPAQTNETTVYFVITTTDNEANTVMSDEQEYTVTDPTNHEVFFSEYIEGSGSNKALEIYNGTDGDINLSEYEIWRIQNGGDWVEGQSNAVVLSGTLSSGAAYVIVDGGADAELLELANISGTSATYFNGDDAVGLAYNGTLIDAVGTEGDAPGAGWEVSGIADATKNHTLVRKNSVTFGNTNWTISAGTNMQDGEWIILGQDNFDFMASHPDNNAPEIISVSISNENTIVVVFSEPVEQTSAETVTNYEISTARFNPTAAVISNDNFSITLTVDALTPDINYYITINGVTDINENAMSNVVSNSFSFTQSILFEDFSECPATDWLIENPDENDKTWECDANSMKANGYGAEPVGASDDWLISPAVDLDATSNEVLTFDTKTQYSGPALILKYSIDYIGSGNPNDYTWTELEFTQPGNDWTSSGNINISEIQGASVYFAFHYTSAGSGSGEAANWWIDNVKIQEDNDPPTIENVFAYDESTVIIDFSESLEQTSAETAINYTIGDAVIISSAVLDTLDNSVVVLTVATLSPGITYNLIVNNVTDLIGNQIVDENAQFEYINYIGEGVIVVNEIHYNPSDTQGSDDDYEFLEIYNAGNETINLGGFNFTEGITYTFPSNIFISPEEFIIIVKNENTYSGGSYQIFQWENGSLGNSGEDIEIVDSLGRIIDYVNYDDGGNWVSEPDGNGPSLALLDPFFDNNEAISWSASVEEGGTPGTINFIPDIISPVFENGFPAVSNIGATSFTLEVQLDEAGTTYYVVVDAEATAPTIEEVMAGNQSGGTPAVASGTLLISEAVTTFTDNATGLTSETNYDIYFVAEDDESTPNIQETVTVIEDILTTQDDLTAPEFISGFPNVTNIASTTFDIEVQLDESGTVFYLVYNDETAAPDITTLIESGTQIEITSSNTTFTETVSGLISGMTYDIYFVARDDETIPNVQSEISAVENITTLELNADLIISEYLEGSSNNKAVEIYNPTGEIVDLTDYVVIKASNGGGWETGTELDLSGMLAAGDVYVIANAGADDAILSVSDITSEITYFNGNDAIGLFKSGELIDVFGDENSGDIFDLAGEVGAAEEHTIIRKSNIEIGNTDWTSSSGTNADDSEWIIYEQNNFSFIGWHIIPPSPVNAIRINELMADNETVFEDPDEPGVFEDWIELYNTGNEDVNIGGLYVSDDFSNPTKYQIPDNDPTATTIPAGDYIILIADEQVEQGILHLSFKLSTGGEAFGIWDTDGISILDSTSFAEQTVDLSYGRIPDGTGIFVSGLENPTPGSANIPNTNDKSIYEIQYTEVPGDDNTYPSLYAGQTVQTTGIVTFVEEVEKDVSAYYIQDGTGAWNGIYVYDNTNAPVVGDEISITADVTEYFGLTELTNVSNFTVISTGNYLSETYVTTAEAGTEAYEGVFIYLPFVECTNDDAGDGMWEINDGSGALFVDDNYYAYSPEIGVIYNVGGIGSYSYGTYKILPRNEYDVEIADDIFENSHKNLFVYPNPASNFVYVKNVENARFIEIYNCTGQKLKTISNFDNQVISIDIQAFTKGLYIINLIDKEGNIYISRFIKM